MRAGLRSGLAPQAWPATARLPGRQDAPFLDPDLTFGRDTAGLRVRPGDDHPGLPAGSPEARRDRKGHALGVLVELIRINAAPLQCCLIPIVPKDLGDLGLETTVFMVFRNANASSCHL
jgi:hypothetical protein